MKKTEYEKIKELVTSEDTLTLLKSQDGDGISELGSELAVYYSRVSFVVAKLKDDILMKLISLTTPKEGVKDMAMNKAEIQAEYEVNKDSEVSRREAQYLQSAIDKVGFACSQRLRKLECEKNEYGNAKK